MICPYCKEEIADGAVKCKHCLSVLVGNAETGPGGDGTVGRSPANGVGWYLEVFKKYAVFSGRARRKEYWYFILFSTVAAVLLGGVDGLLGWNHSHDQVGVLGGIYSLVALLPSIAVAVRRLHDTSRSGWWVLIAFIPLLGAIALLIFFVSDSKPGPNKYGPNPKGVMAQAASQ